MYKVFVEYRIEPQYRADYLRYMQRMAGRHPRLTLYEGTDQPNLFVESWLGVTPEQYEQLKYARKDPSAEWARMHQWVAGGAAKLHIWHFQQVEL